MSRCGGTRDAEIPWGRMGREQPGDTLNDAFPYEQMKSQEQKQWG